jgi:hypothetical protein
VLSRDGYDARWVAFQLCACGFTSGASRFDEEMKQAELEARVATLNCEPLFV